MASEPTDPVIGTVLTDDQRYRIIATRDARFDGTFITAVTSTGIYCRPSCPARTPQRHHVRFFRSAAAAQHHGYRACRRCRPDASPGSPEWDIRGDVVGRAMTLIADGVVDREGVAGLAGRVGYTPRHLHRLLTDELGASPLALAMDARARAARTLIETTQNQLADIAFTSGFGSVRQFNHTVKLVYAATPSQLRAGSRVTPGPLQLVLAARAPFDAAALFRFLAARAVTGVEVATPTSYARTLRLPRGSAWIEARALKDRPGLSVTLELDEPGDLAPAVNRLRRAFDLDADPVGVLDSLGEDPDIGALVRAQPGLRVPGTVDPFETVVRAIVGQQVSVAAARTVLGRLVAAEGPIREPGRRIFPGPADLVDAPAEAFAMPRARRDTLRRVSAAVLEGELRLEVGLDRDELRGQLRAIGGIGGWTADYVAMRCGDPDGWLPTDLGVRQALAHRGIEVDAAERWRPWRAYAMHHLWEGLS